MVFLNVEHRNSSKFLKNVDFSRVANSQREELCHWNHESTVETDDKEYFGLESARQK